MYNKNMLTPRLNCIVNYVNNSETTADIGTDHAYVPIELINSGRAKRVIASDIKPGPLKIAKSHIEKRGLSDRIETRLGSGLSVLAPGEADYIIIAGMGGELICDILKENTETARLSRLVIQPMNGQYELRRYLIENGFTIEREDIENEAHRVYNFIIAKNGRSEEFDNDIDYHLPPYLYSHPKFPLLFDKKRREFKKIINGLEIADICAGKRLNYYRECLVKTEEIRNAL